MTRRFSPCDIAKSHISNLLAESDLDAKRAQTDQKFFFNFQEFPDLLFLQMEGVATSHPSLFCLWSGPQSSTDSGSLCGSNHVFSPLSTACKDILCLFSHCCFFLLLGLSLRLRLLY